MKLRTKIFICCIAILLIFTSSCKEKEDEIVVKPPVDEHKCTKTTWKYLEEVECLHEANYFNICDECGKILEVERKRKEHNFKIEGIDATCTTDGYETRTCVECGFTTTSTFLATGHRNIDYVIDFMAVKDDYGLKHKECLDCNYQFEQVAYSANGYSYHGKLSVVGTDLVDENGEKFQLVGLSTHGLQWANQYVSYDVFDEIHNEFGINVVRLALYTSEGGYCTSKPEYKEFLYNKVVEGINAATKLDMYVIVDWHMVGAVDDNDKNPLYYKEEARDFFGKISKQFADQDNILYEIMNEPCGTTTWEMCKTYANYVIPAIRENSDGIILVGNPRWSSDILSVMRSPLEGYENIMYTYHFYAAGSYNQSNVITAYSKGIPIFISEHGGMESSGDGAIDYSQTARWYEILDARNISYVAWNISNTRGSASIIKTSSSNRLDFSDDNLKEWGIYYKTVTRNRAGLPKRRK